MAFFQKDELKYLGLFYLASFIFVLFSVIEPIVIVYFALKGFSFSELSFALVAFFIAPVIFEVPTGVIADIIGRKFSVISSWILTGAATIVIPFISNPITLTGLFFFMGFAKTLSTGADQAWVIDNLKYYKKPCLVKEYYVKSQSFNMAAFVFSGLLSAWLVFKLGQEVIATFYNIELIGLDFLWFIDGASAFMLVFIMSFIKEEFILQKIHPKHFIKHSINKLKSGFKHSFDNPVIFHLILAAFFGALGGGIFGITYQPFLVGLGVPAHYLGYMVSIFGILGIFIPFIAEKLFSLIKKEKYYLSFVATAHAIIMFSVFFVVSPLAGLAFMTLLANVGYFEKPIERPYFQKYLKSKIRATVASFESMFVHIGGAIAMLIAGFLADTIGPKMTLVASGLFIIPMIFSYLSIHERKTKAHLNQ